MIMKTNIVRLGPTLPSNCKSHESTPTYARLNTLRESLNLLNDAVRGRAGGAPIGERWEQG